MHSYKATNGTIFHYNSDLSGGVKIVVPQAQCTSMVDEHNADLVIAELEAADLLEFVAHCYVLPKKMEQLENADYLELLSE